MTLHVLLVDDQALIRSGVRAILEGEAGLDVQEVDNGYDAIQLVRSSPVDVVLMDIRMPGLDGVEATRRIRAMPEAANVRILVLTTFENDETVIDAIQAGADGFVGKGVEPADLIAKVRSVSEGRPELSANATGALVRHVSSSAAPGSVHRDPTLVAKAESLTPREREIVRLVAEGLRNDEIASREFISQYTVKTHINRAMTKLGVSDRGQLVGFAFRAGLVIPDGGLDRG